MRRFVYSFLGALAVLVPVSAWAQSGTTTTSATTAIQTGLVVKKDGKQLKSEPVIYVTRDDCVSPASEYEFEVRYTTNIKVVELWVGIGTTDCSSAASRQRASTGASESVCKLIRFTRDSANPVKLKASATDLFSLDQDSTPVEQDPDPTDAGSDAGVSDAGASTDAGEDAGGDDSPGGLAASGCDAVKAQKYTVFFIPLDQATDQNANMAYPPVMSNYSTLTATFTLFTQLPDAPTNLSPKDGESLIGVKFSPLTSSIPLTKYRAYFDWGTGGAQCGSGALAEGSVSPEVEDSIASVTSTSTTINLKDLDERDIPLDSQVAVSVVTVDPAGNESLLSAPICVTREETFGFADVCKTDPDCKLDSCALRPGARAGGALGGAALLALAVALFLRRRNV